MVSINKKTAQNGLPNTHLLHKQQLSHHIQQSQQEQQNFSNVVNRSGPSGSQQSTVICNGQIKSGDLNSTAIFNLTNHRTLTGSVEGNVRFLSIPDMTKRGSNINSATLVATNSISEAGNGDGDYTGSLKKCQLSLPTSHIGTPLNIALGTTSSGTYMNNKNIVGVSVSYVDTIRKHDFKNSNLVPNNNFQSSTAEVN